ncbi:flavodoxin family protein [Kribbella monticola]|uniref:flavodoxin family protein n=1 Tax=Kribbella monticola TaxID=2185285 RepID=UPI0018E50EA0|nr:flavodoxin family protein [Kribbella monticola]
MNSQMSANLRALVVYESMFGNTEKVAQAIRDGLEATVDTDLIRVDRAPTVVPDDVRLVVLGGPTHAFGMSRVSTRSDATKQGDVVMPTSIGIREWIDAVGSRTTTTVIATFDTRVTKVRKLPGSAAKGAAKALRRLGFTPLTDPMSFYVEDSTGPIAAAELERARQWGKELGQQLQPFVGPVRRRPWGRSA